MTGSGSTWNSSDPLTVGVGGAGSLTLTSGGRVVAPSVVIAQDAGATGVLNIGAAEGAPPAVRGTLTTLSVTFGAGTGRLVFNHNESFGDSAIVRAPDRRRGAGRGLGRHHSLLADNTYTGGTTIDGGVLEIAQQCQSG